MNIIFQTIYIWIYIFQRLFIHETTNKNIINDFFSFFHILLDSSRNYFYNYYFEIFDGFNFS